MDAEHPDDQLPLFSSLLGLEVHNRKAFSVAMIRDCVGDTVVDRDAGGQ